MTEFNLHHDVHRLLECLELDEAASHTVSEDQVVEDFQKSIKYNTKSGLNAQFLQKLQGHSTPELRKLYDDLKARNVMEVDPLVTLLARLSDNQRMRYFFRLHKNNKDKKHLFTDSPPAHVSRSSSKLSLLRPSSVPIDQEEINGHREAITNALSLEIPSNSASPAMSKDGLRSSGRTSDLKQKRERSRSTSSLKSSRSSWSFLTYDLTPIDWSGESSVKPLSSMSGLEQQMVLIHDLFHVLVGIEGQYVRFCSAGGKKTTLIIDDGCDKLHKTLVERITNICPLYAGIVSFMEEGKVGLVNQAFTASIRCFIKDYFSLITQLESHYKRGDLTLQKMWYILQNAYLNMEILYSVCAKLKMGNCIGGAVLSVLHEKTLSVTGNIKASQFIANITADASKPYLSMLERWIKEGVIVDPHKEFFIEDYGLTKEEDLAVDCHEDSFWENRYSTVSHRMPLFLSRFSEKILRTGKYLSVIKHCGKELNENESYGEPLEYTVEDRVYAERINAAYNFASNQLLHLLLEESNLVGHLNSIKHYFFMDRGDFIVQFMDMAEDELLKEIDDIIPTRLESLLELAVRTSVLNTHPHNDFLGIELQDDSVMCQISNIMSKGSDVPMMIDYNMQDFLVNPLRGYEALTFRYKVEWPLSLILHRESLGCYQILFRHLFCCRFVERQLQSVWRTDKVAKGYALKTVSSYAEAFSLRQKMLHFVQNLEYHMMFEILEPSFHTFLEKVNTKVNCIDDMMKEHTSFYEGIARDCMLTQRNVFHHVVKLLQLCMEFSEFINENQRHSVQFELQGASEDVIKAYECISVCHEKLGAKSNLRFVDKIKRMHEDFNSSLQKLLNEIINQQSESGTGNTLNIVHRLDFNEYYAKMKDGYGRQ